MAEDGTRPRLPVEQSVTSHQSPSDAWRMTTLPGLSESWPSALDFRLSFLHQLFAQQTRPATIGSIERWRESIEE